MMAVCGARIRIRAALVAALALGGCALGELHVEGGSRDRRHADRPSAPDLTPPDHAPGAADLGRDAGPPPDTRPPDTRPPDSVQPDKPKPDSKPPLQVLFAYDFESSGAGLVASKDWQWGKLAFKAGAGCSSGIAAPKSCHSGSGCWGTVLNDCYNPLGNAADACANASTADDSVLRVDFTIPTSYKSARLAFWEWADYFSPFDWVEIRVNGSVAYQDCKSSYTAPSAWTKRTILLNSYLGKKVSVAFHFMASSVINYAGWYLDDLSVEEY
jgi:hypothetical protein